MPAQISDEQDRRRSSIFINAPYGAQHQDLFLAYLTGAVSLGLTPRAAVETYDSTTSRLERISLLLQGCKYSLHDLSAVGHEAPLEVPRFNMPLELGMAITEQYRTPGPDCHRWFAFDSVPYRPDVSLSDLKGYEALIHGGTADGVLRALIGNLEPVGPVTFPEMQALLMAVQNSLPEHYRATGATNIFSPVMFRRVVGVAVALRSFEA